MRLNTSSVTHNSTWTKNDQSPKKLVTYFQFKQAKVDRLLKTQTQLTDWSLKWKPFNKRWRRGVGGVCRAPTPNHLIGRKQRCGALAPRPSTVFPAVVLLRGTHKGHAIFLGCAMFLNFVQLDTCRKRRRPSRSMKFEWKLFLWYQVGKVNLC